MNAYKHTALILLSLLVVTTSLSSPARAAPDGAVMLDILEGETSFLVDQKANKAWWIVGECRRPLPMETSKAKSTNKSKNSIASKMISKDVRIGSRQVTLRQQFRFNMANPPISVDVYNSVRGGWSMVPVRVNSACKQDAACLSRMELPEC